MKPAFLLFLTFAFSASFSSSVLACPNLDGTFHCKESISTPTKQEGSRLTFTSFIGAEKTEAVYMAEGISDSNQKFGFVLSANSNKLMNLILAQDATTAVCSADSEVIMEADQGTKAHFSINDDSDLVIAIYLDGTQKPLVETCPRLK